MTLESTAPRPLPASADTPFFMAALIRQADPAWPEMTGPTLHDGSSAMVLVSGRRVALITTHLPGGGSMVLRLSRAQAQHLAAQLAAAAPLAGDDVQGYGGW